MSAVPAVVPMQRASLVQKFASKYSLEPEKLMTTLKATAFKVREGEVTNEQMAALLVVADQYGLNPFTKEIFAFPDKGGIVPVVGVDGWSRIINEHPAFDGMDFEQDETACTCIIYRKDRAHPIKVTEYMAECKRSTSPWQSHPRRMLRHKALIQCARIAFSFVGIYDEDEAERIIEKDVTPQSTEKPAVQMPQAKSATIDAATDEIIEPKAEPKAESAAQPSGAGPMKPSQAKIIQAKLKNASLTDLDLEAAFPGKALEPKADKELFAFADFDAVVKWIAEKAQA